MTIEGRSMSIHSWTNKYGQWVNKTTLCWESWIILQTSFSNIQLKIGSEGGSNGGNKAELERSEMNLSQSDLILFVKMWQKDQPKTSSEMAFYQQLEWCGNTSTTATLSQLQSKNEVEVKEILPWIWHLWGYNNTYSTEINF